ncbi:hypothetical protein [Acidimangrovimonas pyrenivorans]|uniref:TVP38/TMEM64 family membrane protein n=1 Tax=Acidimangrovimonas pyrenivorans TaxID=2030798 RepID=A0ABV7AFF1_9RHOB
MPDRLARPLRLILRLALFAAAILALRALLGWALAEDAALKAGTALDTGLLVALLVAYALLLAVPFVPGVEIGLTLLLAGGAPVVLPVYLATVAGLSLAFAAGALLSHARLGRLLAVLRLPRAAQLVATLAPMERAARIDWLCSHLPGRLAPHALRHRHVLLALLFNLPGNTLVGGGGGIALVAGLSRLYAPGAFLLTVALAVAPVPLLVWLSGLAPP